MQELVLQLQLQLYNILQIDLCSCCDNVVVVIVLVLVIVSVVVMLLLSSFFKHNFCM